ncbi:type IV pilin protein [Pseudidiomarina terrestris]|uniref:Prepilin-type N-terminal cleavage/methylation domain-containing protein n=1 Tax=Pseudidiomarina terrestris TaxID=2820060 RepID=A0AAW7R1G7_9GAMM|nr:MULTISPECIES: type IV pilin protein [unclassified Pseudidiomarina]MDN7124606.1 prepilin-type N-terminal cleavage/methylation domain-containing protein [Pseudidiomarina sp. 1APP75-32.1]MDN7126848.1 prepilin-type N-terminal cleavage/methylation domain-containing protein [Pseudidiomarina sp. 1APR75-33.1]MDN7129103.1 prepilin-type N-terminal cleavage/methylation domain-containing protein [Pseudidiomarina sp. 1APR75-15]MDN7134633.1 prepilin-type N-terminal cleavage/methylation domain-containing p
MQAKSNQRGMTLIEVMIVIVIIGIIAAVAYPNYVNYVREARRADAMAQLLTLQMAEEEYRLKNTTYADVATLGTGVSSDYYTFSATNIGAETYTLTATATGSQTDDTGCTTISINQNDQKTPAACWQR